jgi:hypothetical protein
MYGFNTEKIEIRPNVVVSRSLPVFPFDLTIDGSPYVSAPIFAANADPGAFVHAVTRIEAADGTFPFPIFDLPLPGGQVVPNEVMTTDNQTVSVQTDVFTGTNNVFRDENLASRRPWRLGDDPAFVEPPQITNAAWELDGFGQLFASWQALPPSLANLTDEVRGFTVFGDFVDDYTEMSPAFLAQVHPTRAAVDTTIPGFQPDWVIDYNATFGGSYTRQLVAQSLANASLPEQGQISTSSITETVFPANQIASRAAVNALPPMPPRTAPQPGTAPYTP